MEEQPVESNTNGELIGVIKEIIDEVNRVGWLNSDTCICNVVRKISNLIDEYESSDENLDEAKADRDYWEEEYNRECRENSSLEEDISSLRNEIDDLKEQLSNKE